MLMTKKSSQKNILKPTIPTTSVVKKHTKVLPLKKLVSTKKEVILPPKKNNSSTLKVIKLPLKKVETLPSDTKNLKKKPITKLALPKENLPITNSKKPLKNSKEVFPKEVPKKEVPQKEKTPKDLVVKKSLNKPKVVIPKQVAPTFLNDLLKEDPIANQLLEKTINESEDTMLIGNLKNILIKYNVTFKPSDVEKIINLQKKFEVLVPKELTENIAPFRTFFYDITEFIKIFKTFAPEISVKNLLLSILNAIHVKKLPSSTPEKFALEKKPYLILATDSKQNQQKNLLEYFTNCIYYLEAQHQDYTKEQKNNEGSQN